MLSLHQLMTLLLAVCLAPGPNYVLGADHIPTPGGALGRSSSPHDLYAALPPKDLRRLKFENEEAPRETLDDEGIAKLRADGFVVVETEDEVSTTHDPSAQEHQRSSFTLPKRAGRVREAQVGPLAPLLEYRNSDQQFYLLNVVADRLLGLRAERGWRVIALDRAGADHHGLEDFLDKNDYPKSETRKTLGEHEKARPGRGGGPFALPFDDLLPAIAFARYDPRTGKLKQIMVVTTALGQDNGSPGLWRHRPFGSSAGTLHTDDDPGNDFGLMYSTHMFAEAWVLYHHPIKNYLRHRFFGYPPETTVRQLNLWTPFDHRKRLVFYTPRETEGDPLHGVPIEAGQERKPLNNRLMKPLQILGDNRPVPVHAPNHPQYVEPAGYTITGALKPTSRRPQPVSVNLVTKGAPFTFPSSNTNSTFLVKKHPAARRVLVAFYSKLRRFGELANQEKITYLHVENYIPGEEEPPAVLHAGFHRGEVREDGADRTLDASAEFRLSVVHVTF